MIPSSYTLPPDQRPSDTGIIEQILDTDRNFVIRAPAASGKTHAAISALKDADVSFVYLASVKPLADEIGAAYDLPVYHAGTGYRSGYQVVTLPLHLKNFDNEGRVLIWDDLNWMVSEYGFRPDTIYNVKRYLRSGFEQVIVLESDPLENERLLRILVGDAERITVRHRSEPIPVEWVTYDDLKTALLDSIAAYPDRSHLISLFNKSDFAEALTKMLEEKGLQETEVGRYNADEGSRRHTLSVLRGEIEGNATQVMLSTYRRGLSAGAGKHVVHIVPMVNARHSAVDISQLASCFRGDDKPPIVRLYYNFPDSFKPLNLDCYEKKQWQEAERRLKKYRAMFDGDLDREDQEQIRALEASDLGGLQGKDRRNLVLPNLSINRLQIYHHVYQKEVDNLYASAEVLKKGLEKHGLLLKRGESHERTEEAPKVEKKRDTEEFKRQVDAYFDGEGFAYGHEIAKRCRYLLKHFEREHARTLMKRYGGNRSKWSKLTNWIEAQRPELPEEKAVKRSIYGAFEVGEELTSGEIRKRMLEINRQHEMLWGANMTKTKATQTLHRYFTTEPKRVRVPGTDDEWVSKREITGDYPLPLPLKEE